ncbi:MAG TPA: lactonase family protein [Phycisphaerae bacterium]|nr:lactonase family protein [Phycisphaerae bacterium]
MRRVLAAALLAAVFAVPLSTARAAEEWVFFGSHHTGPGIGFSRATFDDQTGKLGKSEFVIQVQAPAYYTFTRDGKFLYTCDSGTTFNGQPGGGVSAFSVDARAGTLTPLNAVSAGGPDTSYVALDHSQKHVLAANYGGGSVGVWAIKPDGSLGERTAFDQQVGTGPNPSRQTHAYAHSIQEAPGGKFVLAADLGDDQLYVYRYDEEKGTLTPNDPPSVHITPGDGPRHFAFSRDARRLYLMTEMGSAIHVFDWGGDKGTLGEIQRISALPADFKGTSTGAEILVHPNNRFVYATNRVAGSDGWVAVFSVDAATGKLTPIEEISSKGKMPRNMEFDPTGKWLIVTNHDSNNTLVFAVDGTTGKLTQTGEPVEVPYPFCPRFLAKP